MTKDELPLGLGFALAQDAAAMKGFTELPEEKRAEIMQKARSAASKREMQALVDGLTAED